MMPTTAQMPDATPAPARPAGQGSWRTRAIQGLAVLTAAAATTAAWHGGALGAAVVGTLGLAAAWRWTRGGLSATDVEGPSEPQPAPAGTSTHTPTGARNGPLLMVSQVVPVWSRQMDVTRQAAADGLGQLLENFSTASSALGELVERIEHYSPTASAGSLDEAVAQASPAMQALLAPSERAFAQRNAMLEVLGRCSDALVELQQQAKAAHEVSRHTRLVAFNASVEAQRNQAGHSGSQAVANELRVLAGRMAATGESVMRIVSALGQTLASVRRDAELDDTQPDELQLELQLRAREAMAALLGSLGTTLGGGQPLQESAVTLRNQIDEAFVHFQFGDRISQMLSIVGNDMANFARWLETHPHATQNDAAEWLEALESSYTMEEQRAHHHGNVHVDRGSEVEFF